MEQTKRLIEYVGTQRKKCFFCGETRSVKYRAYGGEYLCNKCALKLSTALSEMPYVLFCRAFCRTE